MAERSFSPNYDPESPPLKRKRRTPRVLSPDPEELFGSPETVVPSSQMPPSPSLQPSSPDPSSPDPPSSPEWNIDFETPPPPPPSCTLTGSIPPSIGRFFAQHPVHVHTQTLAVLSIGPGGFTLCNGFMTIASDTLDMPQLMDALLQLQLGYVVCTDTETQRQLRKLQGQFEFHPIQYVRSCIQKCRNDIGVCPFCNSRCHRYAAVMYMSMYIRFKLEPVPHAV